MKVYLGICCSHNATASLMVNGEIIIAVMEERFTNVKNFQGYPKQSIDYCIQYAKKKNLKIDVAAFTTINLPIFHFKYPLNHFFSIEDYHNFYGKEFYDKLLKNKNVDSYFKKISKDKRNKEDLYIDYKKIKPKNYFNNYALTRKLHTDFLKRQSQGLIDDIQFLDHHTCHAFYSYYSANSRKKNSCIVSIDSEGDQINQSIWLLKNNKIMNIVRNDQCDLGRIYKFITLILNMKPEEHEFKVMGLAAYSKKNYVQKVYEEIFKNILKFKGIKIVHNKRPKNLYSFLKKKCENIRFDNVAGALQYYLEEMIIELLKKINKKYKIRSFYFSGGVAMNVKMFNVISKLKFVDYLHVPPSAADESLCMGGCYYLARNERSKPITNIYLGRDLHNNKKKINLNNLKKSFSSKNYKILKNVSHSTIASLLASNNIIAVARGKEEFGARALGNRSIIANPSNHEMVKKINETIKNRDFWMPFALTILKEDHKKFIKNPKNLRCEYMTMTFDTREDKTDKIYSGCHTHDKTVRPQILEKKHNPAYYSLLKNFKKKTSIPALLNTSLNLHGYPVASIFKNIIFAYKNSALKYLYLNDNFLIIKK